MISPDTPVRMWAVHDTVLGTFSYPHATRLEAEAMRDCAYRHLPPPQRDRLMAIVPVDVTMALRPAPAVPLHQGALFGEDITTREATP